MMKKTILVTLVCLYIQNTTAQVLFTYGKYPVALEAFKASFEKSNPDSILSKSAFQNYLNLFINFKLKVKAAYDLRMDTLPNQIADQLAFEEQVKPIYLLDSATLNMLVNEAVEHRLQEVDLSHIFIAYKQPFNENGDNIITTEEKELAKRKLKEVQQRLKLGESFEEIALAFSNDPEAKYNRGHLGFIKAFTLPYAFEQTAYGLKDGEVSLPVESEAGIHLFKREGSRNIEGNLSVAQILIAIPENAQEIEIKERELLANTIYQEAIKGASFDSLVAIFSEDRSTNTRDGIIVGMETGDYDPVFERQIRGLKKDGQISPVFKTAFGFHILKRISQDTLKINQAELNAETKELVLQDERVSVAKKVFIEKSIGKHGLTAGEKDKEAYISKRLIDFSPAYAAQINDFKDGNLLFEIMDKKIWSKASNDVAALKSFHASRKEKYQWKNSVIAFSITTQNKDIAAAIKSDLDNHKSIESIRKIYSEVAYIDSARQEATALLGVGHANAKAGYISEIFTNDAEGMFSFTYVLKVNNDPSVMEFEEARIQVINDYQQMLEDIWINELKKKYPVSINKSILNKALSALL
jgi:peptidyl-prolyl cis-trans isomerase SurA